MSDNAETELARNDQAGTIVRQGMDGQSIERRDPAALAMAEKQRALVQARIVQAIQRPRDVLACRTAILEDCKRAGFARSALYHVPRGKKQDAKGNWVPNIIEGLSIRFAESAARHFRNLVVEQVVIHDSARLRVVQVAALDLENNFSTSLEISVEKTIERKQIKPGQTPIATRQNSYGDTVYILEANEDEFAVKIAAALSKARRNVILQIIPGDVLDDAREALADAAANANKDVPIAEKQRKCADFFAKFGIGPEKLAEYLGHPLGDATADELETLSLLGFGIREGETTWREIMDSIRATGAPDANGEVKPPAESEAAKEIKERLEAKKAARKAAKTVAAPPPAAPVPPPAPATPAPPQTDPAKELATLYGERIEKASDLAEMGRIGGDIARDEKRLGDQYRPMVLFYQAKRRALEDAPQSA